MDAHRRVVDRARSARGAEQKSCGEPRRRPSPPRRPASQSPRRHRARRGIASLEGKARVRRAVPPRGRAHRARAGRTSLAFLFEVCGCRPTWTNTSIIEDGVAEVRTQVGDPHVICGLSGGVDSAVAAALPVETDGTPSIRPTAMILIQKSRHYSNGPRVLSSNIPAPLV